MAAFMYWAIDVDPRAAAFSYAHSSAGKVRERRGQAAPVKRRPDAVRHLVGVKNEIEFGHLLAPFVEPPLRVRLIFATLKVFRTFNATNGPSARAAQLFCDL